MKYIINSRAIIGLFLVLTWGIFSCSNHPSRFKSGEIYQTFNQNSQINIISSDELEIQENGVTLVCRYKVQDESLRVVMETMGTSQALYFSMIPEGLKDNKGRVFYTLTALESAKKAAIIAQEQEAERQRKEALRQEQENRRIEVLVIESKKSSKVILEWTEPVILNTQAGYGFYIVTKTIITDVNITFSGKEEYFSWSNSSPKIKPFNNTYWFGDFSNFELKQNEVLPFQGGYPKGTELIFKFGSRDYYKLFSQNPNFNTYAETFQQAWQSWKTKYSDIQSHY